MPLRTFYIHLHCPLYVVCQCHAILHPTNVQYTRLYPKIHSYPLLPNSSFHFSKACNPSLLTLGLTFRKLVTKSSNPIARISSLFVVNKASPNDLNGPIAASFVNAVISEPEKPIVSMIFVKVSDLPSWSPVVRVVPL
jgi:hypothetical protein